MCFPIDNFNNKPSTSVLDKVFQLPDFNYKKIILNTNKLSSLREKTTVLTLQEAVVIFEAV